MPQGTGGLCSWGPSIVTWKALTRGSARNLSGAPCQQSDPLYPAMLRYRQASSQAPTLPSLAVCNGAITFQSRPQVSYFTAFRISLSCRLQQRSLLHIEDISRTASRLSCSKKAWRFLSPVSASLSPISPEEDSASGSSEGLGLKIDLNLPRRRLQVSFTCDACGARSQRLINPDACARGTVFVQCAGCEVYHKLVDNLGLIEEYDFRQETDNLADGADLKGLK